MTPNMSWLPAVVRLAVTPLLLGALLLLQDPHGSTLNQAAGLSLVLLAAIHLLFWWLPWPAQPRRSVAAATGMVLINLVLLHLLGLSQPPLWLYPALVVGAGLRASAAAFGIVLTALAAAAPMALAGTLADLHATRIEPLGTSHSILLSIVLAGLGMSAVRQLITVNADLHATKAELAELAVTAERYRQGDRLALTRQGQPVRD